MENSNRLGGARIALLIDFDNVILGIDDPGFDIELVVNALRERGTITVSRVYGDWYRHSRHRRHLMEHGVELVEAPAFGPVIKNSADIKIALDGYEIGMTMPHIDTFCLVSGDSDFLPLIKKLQGLGKNVLVICGNRFTSDMLRRNCNEFISYENLLAASYGADEDATTLEGAFKLLIRAMAALRERGSEIRTSTLKQMMIQLNPVFSEKTFGYNQFRGFLDKAGRENLIKLGPRDRVSGEFYVLLPEEDEADVIDNIERAEPAEVVEEIVESRRGSGRNRRGSGNSDNAERSGNGGGRDNREARKETPAPAATETESPRISRREARLQALREQEESEQQAPAPEVETPKGAGPLASPLTPATDFSPADADEVREKSIARAELIGRGMHPGKFKFSGKTGRLEAVVPTEDREQTTVESDVASTPEDAKIENATEVENADVVADETPDVVAEDATEKPKRSRSRRRKKAPETSAETTTNEESAAAEAMPAPDAATSPAEMSQENESAGIADEETGETPTTEAPADTEAPTEKKPRRRRSSRKKADETPIAAENSADQTTEASAIADEEPVETAPVAEQQTEEKPKPKRTRRRKKTEEISEETTENMEKAIQPDGTAQTVSQADLIEASAGTPAAKAEAKPKATRRRTSRKQAEEAAEAGAAVNENIVTTDETTGEVSQKELAQIPVPISEDEV